MEITRVYTDNDGETHFRVEHIDMTSIANGTINMSEPIPASNLAFAAFDVKTDEDWHTAPRKQAIIILSGGAVELGVSDGEKRRFGPGQVIILEDTKGKGHTTRSVDENPREEVWVHLD